MPNDPLLNALRRKVVAYTAAGRLDLVERCEARIADLQKSAPKPSPAPVEPDGREDGAHAVGGGWYEVVVDGEVIEKLQGATAAQEAYELYVEASD